MTDIEKKLAFLLATSPHLDTVSGSYDEAAMDLATNGVVPVVRCRDCKHWKPSGSKAGNSFSDMEYIGGCEFTNYYRRESDFCSYGEWKEGAD